MKAKAKRAVPSHWSGQTGSGRYKGTNIGYPIGCKHVHRTKRAAERCSPTGEAFWTAIIVVPR